MEDNLASHRQKLGAWGESIATEYLIRKGYTILDRNVRNRYGELDIIASHQDITIFIEVKTRSSKVFGNPEQAITARKQTHILESAQQYLVDHPDRDPDWRVDVIAILRKKGTPPEILHFENAIS